MAGIFEWGFMSPLERQRRLAEEQQAFQRSNAAEAEAKQRAAFGSSMSMLGMKPNDAAALWQAQMGGPEGQLAARGLLDTFMQRKGMDSPMAQAQRQGQVLGNTAQAQGITQQGIMGPLQEQSARNNLALQRAQLSAAANPAAMRPPSVGELFESMTGAKVPSGYVPEDGPMGIRLRPVEGTRPYDDGVMAVRTAESTLELAEQYADLADQVGAETWPSEAKGKARFMHGKLIGDLTQLARTGALNEHDLPRLYGMVPNIADKYLWTDADQEALEAFTQELERAVTRAHEANWYVKPNIRPPGRGSSGQF